MAHVHKMNIKKYFSLKSTKRNHSIYRSSIQFPPIYLDRNADQVFFYMIMNSVGIVINYNSIIIITVYIFVSIISILKYITLTAIFLNNV